MQTMSVIAITPPPPSELLLPVLERRAVTVKNRVQCRQDQVVSWLQVFYTAPGNLEKLTSILQGTSPMSLRLIDYFVTNFAKKTNASFMFKDNHFLVHYNYKRELNAYSKRLFDPFCRRERIMFEARDMPAFVTTVGQLNFFRWFIEKEIYEYLLENREAIESDMNSTLKEHYSRSTASTISQTSPEETSSSSSSAGGKTPRKKRCELTTSAMKKVNVHECDVTVSFC
jgi:hypothetical protein